MEADDFSPLIFYMSMLQWAKFEVLITSLGQGGGGEGVGRGGGDLKNYKRGWKYRAVAGLLKRKGSGIESGSWTGKITLLIFV